MSHSYYLDKKQSTFGPHVQQYDNHMVMHNVSKPIKESILTVDLQYSVNSIVNFGEKICEVKSLEVETVELFNNFYNILAGFNTFTITQNGVGDSIHTITIESGFYTIDTIVNAINTELATLYLQSDISFSVSPTTHKSKFNTSSNQYTIDFTDVNTDICINTSKTLGQILGYTALSYTIDGEVQSMISKRTIHLKNPKHLYLAVNEYSNENINAYYVPTPVGNANKNIIAKISIPDMDFGSMIIANKCTGLLVSDKRRYSNKVNIQRMQLLLLDDSGASLDNSNLVVTFRVQKE